MSYFPNIRMRRMRAAKFSRDLMRESNLLPADFIYPVFVIEGTATREPVPSMPGVERLTVDELEKEARHIHTLGIPAIALFPVVPETKKSLTAEEAYNPDGLAQRAVKTIKNALPELGVMTDVALDPFTSHGQDGLLDEQGYVINDKTVDVPSANEVPLGHKIALKDLKVGDTIFKYGHDIGKVVKEIKKGEHVHVHNVKTKKW